MPAIHEEATITSKGQITLPKPIRQALGVDVGGKVAFDVRRGEVVVTRAEVDERPDPAIHAFLHLIERDLRAGRHIRLLPSKLVEAMLANIRPMGATVGSDAKEADKEIVGEVAL